MSHEADLPIVGIGASAGGLTALQSFFARLPGSTGAAFVIVVHLDPEAPSELARILSGHTAMPVRVVDAPVALVGDTIYVIPPNRRLQLFDHSIAALPFDEPRGERAPIDLFFRSLAQQHDDGLAIILSGAGADGAVGVRAVKEAGGIVLVQDPSEAEFASMPRSAIAMEVADFVLPLHELAARVVELLRDRQHMLASQSHQNDEDVLRRILSHVKVRTGHDFSQYKRATILRRIARRAQVSRRESLVDYYNHLRENVEEAQALFGDFLISVTTFFRDPKAFQSLEHHVIPLLFDGQDAGNSIRVWVPGAATGEEAYTIGMLLLEEAGRRDVRPDIQVFGSDLDSGALAIAREGRFPAAIEADLSEERLRRFFVREGDHYRVRRELRDILLFASHSLLRDPPFSRLDLVSCRNLLIYLDRELQQQVCSNFHYALRPAGFLFLGSSESAEQPAGLFRPIDRDARIYRANPATTDKRPTLPILLGATHLIDRGPVISRPAGATRTGDAALHRQMLERVAPPSMLVDETHRAIHLSENVGRYLQPSGGPMTMDAADLVRQELRFDLRSALHRAFDRSETTLSMPIPVRFNGAHHRVYLHVRPVVHDGDPARYAIAFFIEGEAVSQEQIDGESHSPHEPVNETIRQLREELQLAQTRLRSTREESEAANEELRAANEELQSINEEYRSTSEELETSKEELQSINEELQTVNSELKLKLESVSRAHSDLQNFMAATDVGTLFLDPSLRIKRFTPRLSELFNVTRNDEGRPITDFTHQLQYDELAGHARKVLRDLTPLEHEVQGRNGGWFLVRIRPYRTVDDKIDGVVATFLDITERRRTEEALRENEERLRQEMRLVELSRSPIFVWDFDGGILRWNRGSEELYGFSHDEAIGQRKESVLQTSVPGGSFSTLRQHLLEHGSWRGELIHHTKDARALIVESEIQLMSIGGRRLVLESTRDVTDRRRWEERQQLLLNELTHRVKNTLTVVQSLARQTLRSGADGASFVERFEGRLSALASAHRLLVDTNWQGTQLRTLALSQLRAHISADPDRLRIEGEPVMLPPDLATSFGLVLHELATNAVKYGALSLSQGRVDLSWTVARRQTPARLTVVWQESDGPAVVEPKQRGFGSTLIERSLPGASVRHEFRSDGLICTIDLMLPEVATDGSPDGAEPGGGSGTRRG